MSKKQLKQSLEEGIILVTLIDPTSPISEQFRTIRTNIQFTSSGKKRLQSMVVTSSGPGEGKSTMSANLAVVFAKAGQRVLLIDADLRNPSVFKTFRLHNDYGLSTILSSTQNVMNAIQTTSINNLSVLTSGPIPPNPSELLGSVRTDQVVSELKQNYDIIIFDMPPVVDATDAQIMASKVDGTLLVIRDSVTNKESIAQAIELLNLVNANILGSVYNCEVQSKKRKKN